MRSVEGEAPSGFEPENEGFAVPCLTNLATAPRARSGSKTCEGMHPRAWRCQGGSRAATPARPVAVPLTRRLQAAARLARRRQLRFVAQEPARHVVLEERHHAARH